MEQQDGMWRIKELFEANDPMMLFYQHDGKNKFVHCCIHGEYASYSVYIGTWEGCPPADPVRPARSAQPSLPGLTPPGPQPGMEVA